MATEIVILIVLILINGLFSMSEIAIISARKARLLQRIEKGDKRAKTALELAEKPTRFLSTIQTGITLIGILSGAFGGATVAEKLEEAFNQVPWLAPYGETVAVAIVVIIVTFLSLVIGELVPKRLALNNAEGIASSVAPLMSFMSRAAAPLVHLLSAATEFFLRILRVKPPSEPAVTEEEIKILLDQGRESGVFEEMEQEIVERVFRLSDRNVNSMMTHRSDMVWLDVNDPLEENLRKMIASRHSNYVVCKGDLDHFIGLARAKDLLAEYVTGSPASIKIAAQTPPFVPEGMKALEVVKRLREAMSPLALVMDEYGYITGMVTSTDVLEAIVGDMPGVDTDGEEPEATQREDGSWLFDGRMAVDELKIHLDIDNLPDEDASYDTVGGLMMASLGQIPAVGDHFDWGGYRFEVMDMDGLRVDKVMVFQLPPSERPLKN